MSELTKRLQLLLTPEQYKMVQLYAKKHKKSIGSVIREALDKIISERSKKEKQKAVQRLLSRKLPVSNWEQMEEEIIQGATKE